MTRPTVSPAVLRKAIVAAYQALDIPEPPFTFGPGPHGSWAPPPGDAALELLNASAALGGAVPGLRQAGIACQHGYHRTSFEAWSYTAEWFAQAHPQCPVRWIVKTWHPARAAVRAALGVTATPDPAAQAALAVVRAEGETIAAVLAAHGECSGCDPDLREITPVGRPGATELTLLHAAGCKGPRR